MAYNSDFLLSTASSLEGYRIVKQCGVVFGETVFRHNELSRLKAAFSDMSDSFSMKSRELSGTTSLIDKAREYAYDKMISQARSRGANAIIAIDSDNTFGSDIMYISLFGTAVKAIPEDEYKRQTEMEKQNQIKQEAERAKRETDKKRHVEELIQQKGDAAFAVEEAFFVDINDANSVIEIWRIWCSHKLGEKYPDLDGDLSREKRLEQLYGSDPRQALAMKKKLRESIFGE